MPDLEKINSETLVAFLNSKYGREQINKQSMQSNQVNFSPAKFRKINIMTQQEILEGNKLIANNLYM